MVHTQNLYVGDSMPMDSLNGRFNNFDCVYSDYFDWSEIDPEDPLLVGFQDSVYIVFDNPSNWDAGFNEGDPNDIRQWIIHFDNSFPINSPMYAFPINTNPCDPQGEYLAGAESATLSFV